MTTKVLVVDDEPDLQALIVAKFRKAIKNNEYQFYFASHGAEALSLLDSMKDLNIILTDINMPVMDGLTLLSELSKFDRPYKAVVVSAYGDMSNIRSAMNKGASDFITKPIDFMDFEMTLKKIIEEYNRLWEAQNNLKELYSACGRFVPIQFIKALGKKSIVDVHLGDHIQSRMSVLFCDIRDFTSLAESKTPSEVFMLLNEFLSQMEPIIHKYNGFIDKYIGDAIMALFPNKPDDAINAAIEMVQKSTIKIGIGINSGNLILGILGSTDRIEGSVIGDIVNIASRLEKLTKTYQTPILICDDAKQLLEQPSNYLIRFVEETNIKGKNKPIKIWEVCDADPEEIKKQKLENLPLFQEAQKNYLVGKHEQAKLLLEAYLEKNPTDLLARSYLKKCA